MDIKDREFVEEMDSRRWDVAAEENAQKTYQQVWRLISIIERQEITLEGYKAGFELMKRAFELQREAFEQQRQELLDQ